MPAASHGIDFDPGPRFEDVRLLGEGGMGLLYAAFDRDRGVKVAIKTLRAMSAEGLLRFKDEFRALQELSHPSLVTLGELLESQGQIFFTMELVTGVPFLAYVRPEVRVRRRITVNSGFDEARLRSALHMLASGLVALHQVGLVHRDVKPSNVLVTEEDRVVLLDFGLVGDPERPERPGVVLGTPGYMAPEQALGQPVTPAADWYSFGVMLYRALTGVVPFDGKLVLRGDPLEKRRSIVPPSRRARLVPPDLESLCLDLLRVDPAERPSGHEVLARLGTIPAAPMPLSARQRRAPFVGRRSELWRLADAFRRSRESGPIAIVIAGASGLGKSMLLRRFAEEVPPGTTVLSGRCYERATVPFKAVDEIMDEIGRLFERLPHHDVTALLPADAARLERVFPVLRLGRDAASLSTSAAISSDPGAQSVTIAQGAAARRPVPTVLAPEPEALDPLEQRARLFAAARQLFQGLAARAPLLLALDDVQWADADSLALLAEVLRPPGAPALLLVLTAHLTQAASTALEKLSIPVERITLSPMSDDDGCALVSAILGESDAAESARKAIDPLALAGEAAGHPLLLDTLIRHRLARGESDAPVVRLDDALWERAQRLEPRARALLEPIVIADRPVLLEIVQRVSAMEGDEAARLLSLLRAERLVRLSGAGRDVRVEPYHRRIAETIAQRIPPDAAKLWHSLLAEELLRSGRGQLDEVAIHFHRAGQSALAAEHARKAADEAALSYAFDHAAALYQMVLELGHLPPAEARTVTELHAEALSHAGRGEACARAFLRAADGAEGLQKLDFRRRAAEHYLRAGYVDEGIEVLRDVTSALDLQIPGTLRAFAATLADHAHLRARGTGFVPRREEQVSPRELLRIDLCWSVATGLGAIDGLVAGHFMTRGLRLALAAGEPRRIARALAAYGVVWAVTFPERVAEGLAHESSAEAIALREGDDHLLAIAELSRGLIHINTSHFRDAVPTFERAGALLRDRCRASSWERGILESYGAWVTWTLGDLATLRRHLPEAIVDAENRGDRFTASNLRSGLCGTYALLFHDDPARARRTAEQAMSAWSNRGFHLQHVMDLLMRAMTSVYEGDPRAAHGLLLRAWPRLVASLSVSKMLLRRVMLRYYRAVSAIAAAGGPRSLLLWDADLCARSLEEETSAWGLSLARAVRALWHHKRGEAALALTRWDEAVIAFETQGLRYYEQAARWRRGELSGGAQGRADMAGAKRWLREQGVVRPERAVEMLFPLGRPTA